MHLIEAKKGMHIRHSDAQMQLAKDRMFTCQDIGSQRPDVMLLERLIVSDDLIQVPHGLVPPCKRKEWDAEEHAPCTISQSPQHDNRSCHKEGQGQGMSDKEAHG